MSDWHKIVAAADLNPGEVREVLVAQTVLAVFRVQDEFFALDGMCAHQGGPLGQGQLNGCVVTCPWHGWQYDVRDGQHQSIPALRQRSYPLKVEDGAVFVDLQS